MSSFPGANTLFEGQQINGQTQRKETPIEERTQIGETPNREKRGTKERPKTQIKEDPRADPKRN
jgi:hypothetical protein